MVVVGSVCGGVELLLNNVHLHQTQLTNGQALLSLI